MCLRFETREREEGRKSGEGRERGGRGRRRMDGIDGMGIQAERRRCE